MAELSHPLVLASASPRRKLILEQLGLPFEVCPSSAEDQRKGDEPPIAYALRNAALKADEVAGRLGGEAGSQYVLGADTIVIIGDEVLGKPDSDREAGRMLSLLSGRTHEVITAVALRQAGGSLKQELAVSSRVSFRTLDEETRERYVASGEGRDKAGSYAIQGLGAGLVVGVEGSCSNVVGLPAAQTIELLTGAGVVLRWP